MAPFLLPEEERSANITAWRTFWRSKPGQDLQDRIQKSAARYGFAKDAFTPFLDMTRRDSFPGFTDVPLLKQLSERFISHPKGLVRVFTFFPEEPFYMQHFHRLTQKYPGSFIFSETEFAQRFSASINQEAARLAGYALLLLGLVAVFFMRRVRFILIALSAAVSCVLAVAALFGFWGAPLTAPALVALMIAVGLSIDYGVFMLYSLQHHIDTGSAKAIVISAATTLIGALSLLAARHPALFSIGVSLSTGLGVGWLCAETVVPALYRLYGLDSSEPKHA
jgi:hypothetical protein